MKTIHVAAAIIQKGNLFLTTQRGYGEQAGGWEFPGGKIEADETPEVAIIREIQEELGVTIVIDSLLTVVEHDYPAFHLTMHCFLTHIANGEIQLAEHSAARWLDKQSLDSVDWLPADVAVVQLLKEQRPSFAAANEGPLN